MKIQDNWKILNKTRSYYSLYNYFSERALLEHAINFEQNPRSMAKIFKLFKKKIVLQNDF